MPFYIYEHPETGETKEVLQKMNDDHVYSEGDVEWKRVFTRPNAAIDSQYDCDNPESFIQNTNKNMTLGEMMDESGAQSEQRIQKHGYDPVKQKTVKDYEKKCKGKAHPLKGSNGPKTMLEEKL